MTHVSCGTGCGLPPSSFHTTTLMHHGPREVRYEQARVLGGGSSINGQLANRGLPADYDDWETRGATGWRWETVLPFFRKIERDIDFDGPLHGSSGYIPVRRVFPNNWSDHAKAVAEACELAGFKYVADQNGEFEDGYYPLAISNLYDRRVSAAIGYLGYDSKAARQSVDFDRYRGLRRALRGYALRRYSRDGWSAGDRVPRPRGYSVQRRNSLTCHPFAIGHWSD